MPLDRLSLRRTSPSGALSFLLAIVLLAPAAAVAQAEPDDDAGVLGMAGPRAGSKALAVRDQLPSERLRVELGAVPELTLPRFDVEARLAKDAREASAGLEKRLRIGSVQPLALAARDGAWQALADGARLWAIEVRSPDALQLRLHFTVLSLPAGAELAVTAAGGESGLYQSAAVARLDRAVTLYRGDRSRTAVWTPAVAGDRARIELYLPAGAGFADELPFTLAEVLHVYRDPLTGTAQGYAPEKAAGPCHNDATCFPEWADTGASVARITFIEGGDGFLCTGQLLNNLSRDFTPYFLTANHCIDSNDVANTVQFYWLYQTATCNGIAPSPASVPQSSTATLLSHNSTSDYSLLMAEGTLPNEPIFWAGWTSQTIGQGKLVTSIHHPSGDYKRISFATTGNGANCPWTPGHIWTDWYSGPTEGGSSGGGLFLDSTRQLVGQLHGGESACGLETWDCYGSFKETYKKIRKLMKTGPDDRSEQNDTCVKARNIGRSGTLAGRIVKVNDADWYRINLPKNKTIDITLNFAHGNGDVDLAFYDGCTSEPLYVSDGTTDSEFLSLTNVSGRTLTARWKVYLATDVYSSYEQVTFIHD